MQTYKTEILEYNEISKIDGSWKLADYKNLLELMGLGSELDSMEENEIKEMCMISLTDFEPNEAAKYVLQYLIQDELTDGKLDQISNDMLDDRLWERFADLSFHRKLFDAYSLLREAFNGTFTNPTGVNFKVKITSSDKNFEPFEQTLKPSITRLLASGMGESSILNRLYSDQINSARFHEAENIIWEIKESNSLDNEKEYEIVSSFFWFENLKEVQSFEGKTQADETQEEEEEN